MCSSAPDSFKGTFDARAVADAVATGVRAAGGVPVVIPLADGGEGASGFLLDRLGGDWIESVVADPLGRECVAGFALLADGSTAAVDVAAASGLTLVQPDERDAEGGAASAPGS